MSDVMVLIEHDRGAMAGASLEALTFAADLASQLGCGVDALLIGDEAASLADTCAAHGATSVHQVSLAGVTDYSPEAWGAVVAAAVGELTPVGVVACGTDRGNEVLAHAAAELDLPFVANCLSVKTADDWEMTRVQWGGSLNEDARLTASTPIVSVAHHAIEAVESAPGATAS